MATEVKTSGIDGTYGSDQQKKNDRLGITDSSNAHSNTNRDLSDRASDMADDVSHKAKQTGDTLKEKASDIGHSMQESGHHLAEKTKTSHKAICDFTKENPTVAVLMAFGLGAIISRILPGR